MKKSRAFLGRLKQGYTWQLVTGRRFLEDGFVVYASPYQEEESDEFDLLIRKPGNIEWLRIEVKCVNQKFLDVDEFPYDPIFVEVKRRAGERSRPIDWHICVSRETGAMICLPGETFQQWTEVIKKDTQKGVIDTFMTAEKGLWFTWEEMIDELRKS